MKSLKIGLVMDTVLHADGGVQQVMKELARFLLSREHEIKFIVPESQDKGEFAGHIISLGKSFDPFFNTTSIPLSFFVSRKKIKEVLENENFDIIHVAVPDNPWFGGRIISLAECPVVVTFMSYFKNDIHRFGQRMLQQIFSRSYKAIDACIAPSLAAQNEARSVYGVEFEIIPFAINAFTETEIDSKLPDSEFSRLLKFKDGKFNILFVGRLEERKGVKYLLDAYQKLSKTNDNLRLILVGDGPQRLTLENFSNAMGLEEVYFVGYVNEELKYLYYELADLCVFPATYGESFGVVLVEAMLSGKAPVVFGNEGYSWVMRDIPELIVQNKNSAALADKIEQLIKSPSLLKKFEDKCELNSKQYSWENVGTKILEVYDKVLA